MLRIGVSGAAGRMGRAVIQALAPAGDLRLVAALERAGHEALGRDAGELAGVGALGVPVTAAVPEAGLDVLIDFSHPEATLAFAERAREAGWKMVIGTTGLDEGARAAIARAARDTAIVLAPNMSAGVNVCFRLVELAARALGEEADVEVIEAHHRHKRDAPSGTALRLGEVLARTLGRQLERDAIYGRHGVSGERPRGQIGFNTIRAGEIVGEHTVLFAGAGERVEITHRAESRLTFASGALRAARWLSTRNPGLYDMQDVLGLR